MMDEGQQTSSNINKLLISDRPKARTGPRGLGYKGLCHVTHTRQKITQ